MLQEQNATGRLPRPASHGSPAPRFLRPEPPGRRLVKVLLVGDAGKVRRDAGAAAAVVPRDFRVDAERSGHLDGRPRIIDEFGGNDCLRRHARLDPDHERGERVEHVGAGPPEQWYIPGTMIVDERVE